MFYFSYRYMILYTVQPKIDTKGHCYALALQQILTGVYLAELSLLGLFGLRKATGPSIMIAILFILTIIYNVVMNRYFGPLEKFLPANLASEAEDGDSDSGEDQTPLLSSVEEGEATRQSRGASRVHRVGFNAHVPNQVLDPIARFFQPHIFASHKAMKAWLEDDDFDSDEVPQYKEEDVKKAYLNPALTSPTPVVWLARDEMGVSKSEIRENEDMGLRASDRGAWIDESGKVKWSVGDFGEVPIFKERIRW